MVFVIGMVIHHVENHTDTCLMQGLHHLLKLADTAQRVIRIGAIATLWHVIVHWIIAPVILWFVKTGLIHRAIVITGQDMHIGDAQLLQVVDGPRFGEGQELTRMLRRWLVDREVTVVHLINNQVLWQAMLHSVTLPPLRVGVAQIHHHAFLAIHTHRLGKDARRCFSVDHKLIGLSLVVSLGRDGPDAVRTKSHGQAVLIEHHHATGIGRCKETEDSLVGRVSHLVEAKGFLTGFTSREYHCHHA